MRPTWKLDAEQWYEVDRHILACDQVTAYRTVRELTGATPEEAAGVVQRRCQELREGFPGQFAWTRFPCQDYLASDWADQGCWDETSQTVLIVPAWEVTIRDDIAFLDIGGPGFDGIRWGYRVEKKVFGHTTP
jgi:hypothetical protein